MNNEKPIEIERLAIQITEYLCRNPLAADTVAGIQSWWLSGVPSTISSIEIEDALLTLIERGTLQCNVQPDGTKTYSRA